MTRIRYWAVAAVLTLACAAPSAWAEQPTCPPPNAKKPALHCGLSFGPFTLVKPACAEGADYDDDEPCCRVESCPLFRCPLTDGPFTFVLGPQPAFLPPLPWTLVVETAMPVPRPVHVANCLRGFARFFKEGKYAEAACEAQKARDIDPNSAEACQAVNIVRCRATECSQARGKPVCLTYGIDDLTFIPFNAAPGSANSDERTAIAGSVVKMITSVVAPETWLQNGGAGTIDYFPTGRTIVVNQTPDVQEQVANLLEALRRHQKGLNAGCKTAAGVCDAGSDECCTSCAAASCPASASTTKDCCCKDACGCKGDCKCGADTKTKGSAACAKSGCKCDKGCCGTKTSGTTRSASAASCDADCGKSCCGKCGCGKKTAVGRKRTSPPAADYLVIPMPGAAPCPLPWVPPSPPMMAPYVTPLPFAVPPPPPPPPMIVPPPMMAYRGMPGWTVTHGKDELHVRGQRFEGTCESVTLTAQQGACFEGHVHLKRDKNGEHMEVTALRGGVRLKAGQIEFGVHGSGTICVPCGLFGETESMPMPGAWVVKNGPRGIEISGTSVLGGCDRVVVTSPDSVLLEGHVHLMSCRAEQRIEVRADRVTIRLETGAVQLDLQPGPHIAAAPPTPVYEPIPAPSVVNPR